MADRITDLYELDPSEFVAARNELAKRLRAEGEQDAAKAVAKLRRPTVVVWALNQVARRDPDGVDRLLRAGAAVREGQVRALEAGEADALRTAMRERRELVTSLAAAAAELAGATHRDEAAATLEAASVDPDAGAALRAGRLAAEVDPAGGFDLPDVTLPAPRAELPSARRNKEDDLARRRARRDLAKAEEALAKAEDRLARAEERLADAQQAVDEARDAADGARAERDAARAAVEAEDESG